MKHSYHYVIVLWLAALAVGGCGEAGPELVPVRGKLLDQQGKPVFPGSIWFIADASSPNGPTGVLDASSLLGDDGSFTLRTYPHGDGAMVGRYHVTLSLGAGSSPKLARYAGPKTTPLSVDVPEGGSIELVLRIEENPGASRTRGAPPSAKGRR
jgi:hypothetical protein